MTSAPWTPLSLSAPMRSLRAAAGYGHAAALAALSAAEGHPVAVSTLTSPELRGTAIQLGRLLARAAAYAPPGHRAEVEIRVRWVPVILTPPRTGTPPRRAHP